MVVTQPADFGPLPVVSDPLLRSYIRPHYENTVLAGLCFPKELEPMDIDSYDEDLDPQSRRRIEANLFKRIPSLEYSKYHHGYASIYTIMDDWHPVVGPEPDIEGY